jgi:hypothetical protein
MQNKNNQNIILFNKSQKCFKGSADLTDSYLTGSCLVRSFNHHLPDNPGIVTEQYNNHVHSPPGIIENDFGKELWRVILDPEDILTYYIGYFDGGDLLVTPYVECIIPYGNRINADIYVRYLFEISL